MHPSAQAHTDPLFSGCCANCCSTLLCIVGGILLIVGACIPQRRYPDSTSFVSTRDYDLYFYKQMWSQYGGTDTESSELPDCIKPAYSAGMAMGIIGGATALVGGVPLTYCATKLMTSPLRFVRPFVIGAGGAMGLTAAIISAATTKCEGSDFSSQYKLFVGFGLLIAGAVLLFLSALIGLLQASKCPDASFTQPVVAPVSQTSNNGGGDVGSYVGAYNYAAQQQGGDVLQRQRIEEQQRQEFAQGAPVMGFAVNEQPSTNQQVPPYGGGGLYVGGGGAPIYGNNNNVY